MKSRNILLTLTFMISFLKLSAQETKVERSGFLIGFSAGAGVITIADNKCSFDLTQGGISFPGLKIGWMASERTAILAVLPGMTYTENGKDRSFEAIIPSVQHWIGDRWWLSGGVGLGMDFPAFYEVNEVKDESWNFGCAAMAATGFELIQRKRYTLDLQSRLHMARVFPGENQTRDGVAFSIGVGFNWY